jgi:tyrosyl-tRNA synthetase
MFVDNISRECIACQLPKTGRESEMDVLRRLNERGLLYQLTNEEKLAKLLNTGKLSFYIGFDATAESLHIGHLIPLMAASWLQKDGHNPLIIIGGGTALIGDPSFRNTERNLESREKVQEWVDSISIQMRGFLRFGDDESDARMLNNLDWLNDLNYIEFLRSIGKHFSVNRMLSAESVKLRLETGLSFLEFNYMLLQSYDFLHLFRSENCILQVGGADQWGNIVAGIDLIRRMEGRESYGATCPLVTTSTGEKMSKTAPGGAIWLDPSLTSPYDYYQFWINVDDRDAIYFLKLYTFVPLAEIEELSMLEGAELRRAKERLAFEATTIAHGVNEAEKAMDASRALFSGVGNMEQVPTLGLPAARLADGINCLDLFVETGLCPSRAEVRRLAKQGGLYLNGARVTSPETALSESDIVKGHMLLRAGKKRYYKVTFST